MISALAVGDVFDIYSVFYSNSFGSLVPYETNYAGEGTQSPSKTNYNFSGTWTKTPLSFPISTKPAATLDYTYRDTTLPVAPASFSIVGDFFTRSLIGTGIVTGESGNIINQTTNVALPSTVSAFASQNGNWSALTLTKVVEHGELYITKRTPIIHDYAVTTKRLRWSCVSAAGESSDSLIADAIHDALTRDGEAPFEPTGAGDINNRTREEDAVWKLLDGQVGGECDEQARLMASSLKMLGVPAEVKFVFASTDADVFTPEHRIVNGQRQWLLLDFSEQNSQTYNWNMFEGVCLAAGNTYAVWPALKGTSGLEILRTLGPRQFWISFAENNINPADKLPAPGWNIKEIYEEVPLP